MVITKSRTEFKDIEIDTVFYGKVYDESMGFVEITNKTDSEVKIIIYVLQHDKIKKMITEIPHDIWDNLWMQWSYLEKSTYSILAKLLLAFPIYKGSYDTTT